MKVDFFLVLDKANATKKTYLRVKEMWRVSKENYD